MTIQIDTREKARAIKDITQYFEENEIAYFHSKLYIGDYMNIDNPRLIIDRKQNLSELCTNVTSDHDRFRRELLKAKDNGIQLVILIEHGKDTECLEDVIFWENPRSKKRVKIDGKYQTIKTKATSGQTLYNILCTLERKYGVKYAFCDKEHTGHEIVRILSGEQRRD
ncbi:MAG: ERCC4 domain-containing protein [Lachnospiraceae bacterium]